MNKLCAALVVMAIGGTASDVAAQEKGNPFECAASHSRDRRTGLAAPSDCSNKALRIQVTGGEAAPDERYTAAIIFTKSNGEREICSGVLLDDRNVLTAGHCGCGVANSYQITFDQFARKGNLTTDALEIQGGPILFDPLACLRGEAPGNDLALLRLKTPVFKPGKVITPGYPFFFLAADIREQLKPGMELKVVGFGETETGGIAVRMKATVPILTPDCSELPYNLYCAPFQEMILAEREGRSTPRDTCSGDSGGPAFVRRMVTLPECIEDRFRPLGDPITQPQDVVFAITSRAAPFTQVSSSQPCGQGGIYTLVGRRSVYAWLDQNHVKPQTCVVRKQ